MSLVKQEVSGMLEQVLPYLVTREDFENIIGSPENQGRLLELIYGEVREKMPTEEHAAIAAMLVHLLMSFVLPRQLGRVTVEARYSAPDDDYNDRLPDVAFTHQDRLAPQVTQGAVPQMPDLAIEIKSPSDRPYVMRQKALYYLQKGSRLVWLIYPESKSAEVCILDENGNLAIESIKPDGTLSGAGVLPEFSLSVRAIFSQP